MSSASADASAASATSKPSAGPAPRARSISSLSLRNRRSRAALSLFGGGIVVVVAIPAGLVKGSTRDDKPEVVYRVTLCWTNAPSSSKPSGSAGGSSTGGSSSSDAPAAVAMPWHYHDGNGYRHLVLEQMDWGQSEGMSEARRRLPYDCDFSLSIFLGESPKKHPSIFSADAEDFHVRIDGSDIKGYQDADPTVAPEPMITSADLPIIGKKTGIDQKLLKEALGTVQQYRLRCGLLQRCTFVKEIGGHEFLTVIPDCDWRSSERNGEKRKVSLRDAIIFVFHDTAASPHRGRDATIHAILNAGCWWDSLWNDVNFYIKRCDVCSREKNKPLVTGRQRIRQYDGPFRFLVMDFVGPISPKSARGNEYMFTCCCAWSGYYWAFPCTNKSAEVAAHNLFYHVMCDLAGYPSVLSTDNDKAFTGEIINCLVGIFGVDHVLGTAYHPMAQSPVERPHREFNSICRSFMERMEDWDLMVPIFVWTIRTTTKLFNGYYTPYECVTGLKPRSPIDALVSTDAVVKQVTKSDYVKELVRYLKEVHSYVDEQHQREREKRERAKLRELGEGEIVRQGDYVLLKVNHHESGVSARFQHKNHEEIFQIKEIVGSSLEDAKAYILQNLAGSTDIGHLQPVAREHLTPVEITPLLQTSGDARTRLLIDVTGHGTEEASIVSLFLDGKVLIQTKENSEQHIVDLTEFDYQWLADA